MVLTVCFAGLLMVSQKGATAILIPEITWKWGPILNALKKRASHKSNRYSLVVVAEGCTQPGGTTKYARL